MNFIDTTDIHFQATEMDEKFNRDLRFQLEPLIPESARRPRKPRTSRTRFVPISLGGSGALPLRFTRLAIADGPGCISPWGVAHYMAGHKPDLCTGALNYAPRVADPIRGLGNVVFEHFEGGADQPLTNGDELVELAWAAMGTTMWDVRAEAAVRRRWIQRVHRLMDEEGLPPARTRTSVGSLRHRIHKCGPDDDDRVLSVAWEATRLWHDIAGTGGPADFPGFPEDYDCIAGLGGDWRVLCAARDAERLHLSPCGPGRWPPSSVTHAAEQFHHHPTKDNLDGLKIAISFFYWDDWAVRHAPGYPLDPLWTIQWITGLATVTVMQWIRNNQQ